MFKLAQNAFKPMSAHIPKVTNPFASAKPMPLNINGTGYTPPVKTWNSSAPVKNDSYFGGLYNDLKSVGAGINNFVKSTVDTGNRAVKGWGRLVDPTSSTTIGQRAGWLGKGLTSVGKDFVPGMAQGTLNLIPNSIKSISDIGTGVINSLSGGFFDKAKKNVDNFTSKITNPFKVNFAGNRTGVQQEAFNVGQTTGEIAATAGAGAAVKAGTQLLKNTGAWRLTTPVKYLPQKFKKPVFDKIDNALRNVNSSNPDRPYGNNSIYDMFSNSDLLSRYNPFKFKPSENMAYRGLGPEGFAAAKESGKLAPRANSAFDGSKGIRNMFGDYIPQRRELYFGEGVDGFSTAQGFNPYSGKKYVAEVPKKHLNLQEPEDGFGLGLGKVSLEDVPLSTPGAKIYENSTFRGWKPVDMNNITAKNYAKQVTANAFKTIPVVNAGKRNNSTPFYNPYNF
jgi:hypothetical protein